MRFKDITIGTLSSIAVFTIAGMAFLYTRKFIGTASESRMIAIIREHSAPGTFSIVGSFVIMINSLFVTIFGKSGGPAVLREYLISRPAQFSLGLVAAFVGLLLAYSVYYARLAEGVAAILVALAQGGALVFFLTIKDGRLFSKHKFSLRVVGCLMFAVSFLYFCRECSI